jgi:hypothetical protein
LLNQNFNYVLFLFFNRDAYLDAGFAPVSGQKVRIDGIMNHANKTISVNSVTFLEMSKRVRRLQQDDIHPKIGAKKIAIIPIRFATGSPAFDSTLLANAAFGM